MNAVAPTQSSSRIPVAVSEQLKQLEEQLETLRAQVRQAQQLASLGVAAATIAHEVNNLLTPIIAYGEAAQERGDQGLKDKAVRVAVQNARMLVAMSDRVLRVSAAHRAERQPTPIHATAEEAAQSLGRDLAKDSIAWTNQIEESLTGYVDRLHLQQVFFNLFLNVRDAMATRHGGRLTVSAHHENGRIRVDIKDTGGGIDPAVLPHIFDPLHSTKAAQEHGKERCRGLGLALCHDLIRENGGSISVTTEVGHSTTFSLFLPIAAP